MNSTNTNVINPRICQLLAIGLHSAAIVAFQVALMKLISVVQWHHFAYMIISIAMLGFGAAGALLALFREKLLNASVWLIPLLMAASGILMMAVFPLSQTAPIRFDLFLLFVEPNHFPLLFIQYLLFFLPFFTSAMAIGIQFTASAGRIGQWYFVNMAGSGIGSVLVLLIIAIASARFIMPVIGLMPLIASAIYYRRSWKLKQLMVAALFSVMVLGHTLAPPPASRSAFKDLSKAKSLPGTKIVHSSFGLHGQIDIVDAPHWRFAPSVSLVYQEEMPVKEIIFVNGDYYGIIPSSNPAEKGNHILDFTTMALPYVIQQPKSVLILNAGTGADLDHAMSRGVENIDAVENNRELLRYLIKRKNPDELNLRGVSLIPSDPRFHLSRKPGRRYDLIVIPLIGSFGGSAGIQALHEDYSLTVESFIEMQNSLSYNGMLVVSAWVDYPVRSVLKVYTTIKAAARERGIENISEHLIAIRSWGTVSYVFMKTAPNKDQIQAIESFCKSMLFDPLLLPGIIPENRTRFNQPEDMLFFEILDRLARGDDTVYSEYGFNIRPATDNKPFFSHFLSVHGILSIMQQFGPGQLPFFELGYLIVLVSLIQSILFTAIFIILPLSALKKGKSRKKGTLVFFGILGVAYMFTEIILIQTFVRHFGHPVVAISAVIGTMLTGSAAGSLVSEKLKPSKRNIIRITILVSVLLVLMSLRLSGLMTLATALGQVARISLGLAIIGIPAFFMGMLFPLGLRYIHAYDSWQVPWAWGINGSLSVVSTSLATLIAVNSGMQLVLIIASLMYLCAAIVFFYERYFFGKPGSN